MTTTSPTQPNSSFFMPNYQLPSLYATVFKLTATQSGQIPATQGRLSQAAFLDIIRAVDPALAEVLHTSNERRPYTTSPVMDLPRPKSKQRPIKRGQQVWLRATLLDSVLFESLTRYLLLIKNEELSMKNGHNSGHRWDLPTLRLGRAAFAISEMLTTPGSHDWAGYTQLGALIRHWEDVPLDKSTLTIQMEFASPTVFSLGTHPNYGKMMEMLPYPAIFFGSMAARWNALVGWSNRQAVGSSEAQTPLAFDTAAIRAYAEETIVVGRYKLNSQPAQFWNSPQMGFVGQISYLLKDTSDEAMIRTLNLLADFAFYSGVGAKTAMGMGMGRRVKREA